jgi:hypothetical protein
VRSVRQVSIAVGTAVVVAMLAGCGSPGQATTQPRSEPAGLAGPAVLDLLTRTGSYEENEYRLRIAENLLVGKCMKAKGISYSSGVDGPAPAGGSEQVLRLEERRRDGYGLFKSYSGKGQELPEAEQRVRQLPPDQQAAYHKALMGSADTRQAIQLPGGGEVGFPTTGCIAEARRRLFGDLLVWARVAHVPSALDSRISQQVGTNPTYVKAERAWRGCMKGKGYAYQHPGDGYPGLQARYEKEGPSQRLRQQEIAIAVADAECARQAKIPAAVRTAKQHGAEELTEIEQQALRELTRSWLTAVANARRIAERRAG